MRKTREDIVMPLTAPIRGTDGTSISEIPVPKGTHVHIAALASNRNPQLWGPDAGMWKPERWLNPLPETIKEAHIPGVYSNLYVFYTLHLWTVYAEFVQYDIPGRWTCVHWLQVLATRDEYVLSRDSSC